MSAAPSFKNLACALWDAARTHPDATAIRHGDSRLSYTQLLKQVMGQARWLQAHGVTPGDRVAVYSENCPEYLAVIFAIYSLGAITVPINSKLQKPELQHICLDSEACILLMARRKEGTEPASPGMRVAYLEDLPTAQAPEDLTHAPVDVAAGDLATLFYTSGTTGKPKGVMLSHGNLWAMTHSYLAENDNIRDATMVYAAPISHGAGMYMVAQTVLGGVHCFGGSGGFDADEILQVGRDTGNVVLFAAPTMLNRIVQHAQQSPIAATGLQNIIVGGAPLLKSDLARAIETLGPVISQIYGQGECPMLISHCESRVLCDRASAQWDRVAESCGKPYAATSIRIDEDTRASGIGMGEILVRGDAVMQGYWRNTAATAEAIEEGWLRTGDVGLIDESGLLHIKDRIKDMIISGGSNVYSVEVESALQEHPDVLEVAVFGVPDPAWGERVIAALTLRTGASTQASDLAAFARERLADYKRPKQYLLVPQLPKSHYGKFLKNQLKKEYLDGARSVS